jgi:hypothetical protein
MPTASGTGCTIKSCPANPIFREKSIHLTKYEYDMDAKSKLKGSGGVIPNNFRQGSRAEIIAQYFFSEFCIAERVTRENDFGVDLYCTLMKISGSIGLTSTLFGVQIKSGDAPFMYAGEYVALWLKTLNIPLLMCRIDRSELSVKVYSAWTLNSLVTEDSSFDRVEFLERYSDDSEADFLKMPIVENGTATVWMGPPIIECTLEQLINGKIPKNELGIVIKEWIEFDFLNYAKRHIGIPAYFGYTKWITNQSLETSQRKWYNPHHFSDSQSINAVKIILESGALVALNKGKEHPFVTGLAELIKNNGIVNPTELNEWHKDVIGIRQ